MAIICNAISRIVKRRSARTAFPYKRLFRGAGYFAGQVLVGKIPKQARVEVIHSETKIFVTSVMSDVTGFFVIMGLKEGEVYDIISIDPNGEWEKKVSSNRVPEVWTQ